MIPFKVINVGLMPENSSGKIDRAAAKLLAVSKI